MVVDLYNKTWVWICTGQLMEVVPAGIARCPTRALSIDNVKLGSKLMPEVPPFPTHLP